jgi:poly(A) polymerase Pap1
VSDAETAARLQELLDRLEDARGRLEAAEDSEAAVDVLQDLVQLAKEVQAEIERQKGAP